MRNRDIVFALKMVNRSKPALTAFSGDFRRAARDAQEAAKSLGSVSSALDRVGSSSARSGAQLSSATNNMRKALVTIQQQAKQTQSALQAAFGVQPGANFQQASRRGSSNGSRRNARTPLVNGNATGAGNGAGQIATLKQGFDEATRSAGTLQTAINGVIGILTVGFGTKKLLDTADTYTMLRGQITLVSRSQEEMNAVYERTFDIAQRTRQSFDGTVQLYSRLVKSTENAGYSTNQLLGVTETINKALATTPGPASSAEAALIQLAQGLAAGALRGEELNSVLEQAPRLAKAIADGMNVPVGSLKKLAEQNKLTTDTVVRAIMSQRSVIDSEFAKLDKTASQAFTILGNAMVDLVGRADKATGATSGFANTVTAFADRLRDPALMVNAIKGFEMLGSVVSGLGTVFMAAINNVELVAAALAVLAARMLLLPFGAIITAAWNMGAALVSLASGAGLAATGFTALQLSLGVIGVVVAAAAGAFAYFSTSAKGSSAASSKLADELARLRSEGKDTTEVIKKMTEAQRNRATVEWRTELVRSQDALKKTALEAAALAASLDASNFPSVKGKNWLFGDFEVKSLSPFKAAIDSFLSSIKAGTPDVRAFVDTITNIAANSGDSKLIDMAAEMVKAAEEAEKADEKVRGLRRSIEELNKSSTNFDLAPVIDGAKALKNFADKMADLSKVAGQSKETQQAIEDVAKATALYEQAVNALGDAFRSGDINNREYQLRLEEARRKLDEVKAATNGVTEAQKEMRKLQSQNAIDGMEEGRAKKLAELKQKYDELAEGIKKSVYDPAEATKLLIDLDKQRAVAVANIDAAYRNGAFKDRLQDLDNEKRLLGLIGEERERETKRIEVENEARWAGVTDVNALTAAYMQQYDMLKKLQDQTNQSFGAGFSNAIKSYVQETKSVTAESQKMWGGVFSKIEDGIVEVVTTGKLNFQNFLSSLAQEFARFAARQLLRSLLGGMGDGSSSGGGWLGQIISGITNWFTGNSGAGAASSVVSKVPSFVGPMFDVSSGSSSSASTASVAAAAVKAITGGTTISREELLGAIMKYESGGRNIMQNIVGANGGFNPSTGTITGPSSAQGYFQITNSTWKDIAGKAGIDLDQYPNAMSAPFDVQKQAANALIDTRGMSPWAPYNANLRGWMEGKDLSGALGKGSSPLNYTSDMSKYTLDQGTIDKLNQQFGDISNSASGMAPSLSQLDTGLTQTAAQVGQSGSQINNGLQQVSSTMQQGGTQVGAALTTTAATTTTGGVAVGTGLTTTATQVTAGGAQVGAALQTAAANISASSATEGGGIGGFFKSLFGFGGAGAAGARDIVHLNHTGGLAGRASGMTRSIDSRIFSQARRFHSGGIPGLKSNEEAIIAEKDEALLPTVRLPNGKFGVSAAGLGGGGGGNVLTVGDVNVMVEGGSSGNREEDEAQAKRIGKEIRTAFKGMIAEWSQDQSRPGGVLFKGV